MRSNYSVLFIALLAMSRRFTTVRSSTVLAKSNMLICRNDGSVSNVGDTKELLQSQKCKKKLIVTLAVESNQGKSEQIHAVVDSVTEEGMYDKIKLKKPFRIQVTKSSTRVKYPLTYRGRVNHQPYETIVKKRHPAPCCGTAIYDRCTEGWFDGSNACPWWYHVNETEHHRSPPYTKQKKDPETGANRAKVWASQGFCCVCEWAEKHDRIKPHARGGRSCTWYIHTWVRHQAYAHCLAFDPLWDRVYEIHPPYPTFSVNVSVTEVDRIVRTFENYTRMTWKNVGYFMLSPRNLKGVTAQGRVHGEYVGDLQVSRQLQKLGNKYLVWPEWYLLDKNQGSQQDWIAAGHNEWLILDKYLFDFRGETCNKIGVSFSGFKFGQNTKCRRKKGSCLDAQPVHFLEEARNERKSRRGSPYFLDFYGNFVGSELHGKYREPGELEFQPQENYNSIIVLTLDATDIALVYNRSPGRLVEAHAEDFEALSKSGMISVIVLNTGQVASDYTVTVSGCSSGIGIVPSKKATIDPGLTKVFEFELEQYYLKGGLGLCTVSLYDVKFVKLDSMTVNFTTFAPCFCPRTCNCSAGCTRDLIDCANITDIAPRTNSSMGWAWLGNALSKVWSAIKGVFSSLWSGLLTLIGTLLLLGMIKVAIGVCMKASKGLESDGGPAQQDEVVKTKEVVAGKTGISSWLLTVKQNRNIALLKGMFYFVYCPFIPCFVIVRHVIAQITTKKELRKERKERKMKELVNELSLDKEDDEDSDSSETDTSIVVREELKELDYGLSDEYSMSEVETSDEPQDIDELLDYKYPVFFNFCKVNSQDLHPDLENPGRSYSLCGQLQSTSDVDDYHIFDTYKYNKQMIQIINGKVEKLDTPIDLPDYNQLMDTDTTLQFITYKPLFPCLNRRYQRVKKTKAS